GHGAEETANQRTGGGTTETITAAGIAFGTDQLTFPAGEPTTLTFENEDSAPHNVAIYETKEATEELFVGRTIDGGASTEYKIPALEAGEYFFRCDVHPSMTGTVTVK
ncbi:MAG TPA: cupredoxin domain-containing protein, partial [Actinomycetota bacterium]|nr:cupredoxin domain-containing protein [Actinomycetota bacterium]